MTFRIVEEDSPFAIQGNQIVVADAAKLHRRADTTIPVKVAADHAQGGTTTGQFVVRLIAENDTPFAIELSNSSVTENELAAGIGELTFSDPDIDDGHTIALSDERFEVVDGQLRLKAGQSLNHEVEPTVNLVITVKDVSGATTERSVGMDVLNASDLPTQIALNDLATLENLEEMPFGTLEILDEDADAAFDILFHHAQLELDGNTIRLKQGQYLDRSEAEELSFTSTVVDQSNSDIRLTRDFQLTVQANEAAWQNTSNALDVNGDGFISPIDVLLVINVLNSQSIGVSIPLSGSLLPATRVFDSGVPYLDTSGDNFLTPIDALLVINHLNKNPEGEGADVLATMMPAPPFTKRDDPRDAYFAEYDLDVY